MAKPRSPMFLMKLPLAVKAAASSKETITWEVSL